MVIPIVARGGFVALKNPWVQKGLIAGGGGIAGWLLKGSKKTEQSQKQAQDQAAAITTSTHVTDIVKQRTYHQDYSTNMTYGDNSPIHKVTSQVPSATQTPHVSNVPTIGQEQMAEQKAEATSGSDLVTLALIAGVAVIGYGYVSK